MKQTLHFQKLGDLDVRSLYFDPVNVAVVTESQSDW
jgi:hypothetical protein